MDYIECSHIIVFKIGANSFNIQIFTYRIQQTSLYRLYKQEAWQPAIIQKNNRMKIKTSGRMDCQMLKLASACLLKSFLDSFITQLLTPALFKNIVTESGQ